MEARLRQALARAEEVARESGRPRNGSQSGQAEAVGREHARLDAIRQAHTRLEHLQHELAQAREVLHDQDAELVQLARSDVERLRPEVERVERELTDLLTPNDPWTTATRSWKSARGPEATRRPSSPPTCSACTPASPSAGGGRSRSCPSPMGPWVGSRRRSSRRGEPRPTARCATSQGCTASNGFR